MYRYVPASLPANAPLVVVLHGCTQNALQAATETGWNTMADRHGFYLVYPEQTSTNNSSNCFNWFLSGDHSRNQGEALSIKEMVDDMIAAYSIDPSRIYVTGLSAGAAMTNVMLAAYPEMFSKGAVIAGVPYKAATTSGDAWTAMSGGISKTPVQWGDLVRNENPNYSGPFPRVAIVHGTSDFVVSSSNVTEQVKQWTNVHSTDQTADATVNNFAANTSVTMKRYFNSSMQPVVETYILSGFGHAVPLDTGNCFRQCGVTGTYAIETNFSSTYWAANFFDILQFTFNITGPSSVSSGQQNVTYTANVAGYTTVIWSIPPGAMLVSGQGTSTAVINFGSSSGEVSVTAFDQNNCIVGPDAVWVNVGVTGMNEYGNDIDIYYNSSEQALHVNSSLKITAVNIFDMSGKLVKRCDDLHNALWLDNGIYLAEVITENMSWRKKISVTH
jgi:poly(hydroxyalkanoate) depolymerase family esterase